MQIYIITELQKNTKVSSMYTNGQWTWPQVSDFQMLLREGFKKKYGNFHTFADPPPKVWKIIFYFFSIVDHYWRYFGNFENIHYYF